MVSLRHFRNLMLRLTVLEVAYLPPRQSSVKVESRVYPLKFQTFFSAL